MKYMGSKNRIAKYILPIIMEYKTPSMTWVEPFVGGANMIDKVEGPRIGADSNEYLIAMWRALQNGWVPPDFVSEQEWQSVKENMDLFYEKHYIAFVRFGCSFGSDWFGGYARNVAKNKPNADLLNRTTKSYCKQSKNNILKQLPGVKGVDFKHCSFIDLKIPPNSLIYCDPPYEGTTKYKDDFNHTQFWDWCRGKAFEGHRVFVSEYEAPSDFVCLWAKDILNGLDKNKRPTEKLFAHITT